MLCFLRIYSVTIPDEAERSTTALMTKESHMTDKEERRLTQSVRGSG